MTVAALDPVKEQQAHLGDQEPHLGEALPVMRGLTLSRGHIQQV